MTAVQRFELLGLSNVHGARQALGESGNAKEQLKIRQQTAGEHGKLRACRPNFAVAAVAVGVFGRGVCLAGRAKRAHLFKPSTRANLTGLQKVTRKVHKATYKYAFLECLPHIFDGTIVRCGKAIDFSLERSALDKAMQIAIYLFFGCRGRVGVYV